MLFPAQLSVKLLLATSLERGLDYSNPTTPGFIFVHILITAKPIIMGAEGQSRNLEGYFYQKLQFVCNFSRHLYKLFYKFNIYKALFIMGWVATGSGMGWNF